MIERVLKEIEGSSIDHELAYQRLNLLTRSISVESEDTWRKYERINRLLFKNEVSQRERDLFGENKLLKYL